MGTVWPLVPLLLNVISVTATNLAKKNRAVVSTVRLTAGSGRQMLGMLPRFLSLISGAKTIQQRNNPTTYAKGASYRATASSGDNDTHPGRYHTLRNQLECELYIGSMVFVVSACRSGAGRRWQIVNRTEIVDTTTDGSTP